MLVKGKTILDTGLKKQITSKDPPIATIGEYCKDSGHKVSVETTKISAQKPTISGKKSLQKASEKVCP